MDITNIETMNDEQLGDYVNQLSTKLAIISRLQSGSGAADQIQRMLAIARAQMMERAQGSAFKQLIASRPSEIISDPSLRPKDDTKETAAPKKPTISRISVRRSDRPISAIDLSPEPPKPDKDTDKS